MSALRKVVVLLSMLALLLVGAVSAASASTPSSNPADWGWPSFQQNSVNYSVPDVRTIQYLLNARGAGLVVDGRFGPRTDAAVRSFQQSHGLAVDGIVGPHTWAALIITVQRGSTGSAVRALQDQLDSRYIGGPVLAVDGIFGPLTDAGVRYYQANVYRAVNHPDFDQTTGYDPSIPYRNFAVDGIVGPLTWYSLTVGFFSAG